METRKREHRPSNAFVASVDTEGHLPSWSGVTSIQTLMKSQRKVIGADFIANGIKSRLSTLVGNTVFSLYMSKVYFVFFMFTGEADIHHHACGHQAGPVEQRLDAVRNYPAGIPADERAASGASVVVLRCYTSSRWPATVKCTSLLITEAR